MKLHVIEFYALPLYTLHLVSLETFNKSFPKDCDEMFAKERDWALSYGSQIKDASEKFSAVANARLRLIQQLGHLAGALSITVAGNIIIIIIKNIIIINTIILSKQSSTLSISTTMQWSESLSTLLLIMK